VGICQQDNLCKFCASPLVCAKTVQTKSLAGICANSVQTRRVDSSPAAVSSGGTPPPVSVRLARWWSTWRGRCGNYLVDAVSTFGRRRRRGLPVLAFGPAVLYWGWLSIKKVPPPLTATNALPSAKNLLRRRGPVIG